MKCVRYLPVSHPPSKTAHVEIRLTDAIFIPISVGGTTICRQFYCNGPLQKWKFRSIGISCEFASVVYHKNRCTRELHRYCTQMIIITTQCSYASAVLGVVILSVRLSVRPSVCHTRALWLIQRTYLRYFYTTWKGNPSSFLPCNSGWSATSPST